MYIQDMYEYSWPSEGQIPRWNLVLLLFVENFGLQNLKVHNTVDWSCTSTFFE